MRKTTNIFAIVLVAIIGSIIFWKRDYIKSKLGINSGTADATQSNNVSQNAYTPAPSPSASNTALQYTECRAYPLKIGCTGKNVENIQKALNRIHASGLQVDGKFGPQTKMALIANGYGETVDLQTMAKMSKNLV